MRVLIVIALIVGVAFILLFVLLDLARELSHYSDNSPLDLDGSNEWDVAQDEFEGAAPPAAPYTQQWPVGQYHIARTPRDNFPGSSNALDDLHSVL